MPVNSMPESASPYGLLHMAGNVLEYVAGDITPSTDAVDRFSKILQSSARAERAMVQRQGRFVRPPLQAALPWEWSSVPARYLAPDIGFRCARDP